MNKAREIAAQCWCDKETENVVLSPLLAEAVAKRINRLLDRIEQLEDSEELAWGLIANAYGGDWDLASEASGWKAAAERWRDAYLPRFHATLSSRSSEVEVP